MSSHAVTSTPIDLVATASLAAGSTYSLQCSGDYEIELHQDDAGTLTADTVRGAAGPRPVRLLPATSANSPAPPPISHAPARSSGPGRRACRARSPSSRRADVPLILGAFGAVGGGRLGLGPEPNEFGDRTTADRAARRRCATRRPRTRRGSRSTTPTARFSSASSGTTATSSSGATSPATDGEDFTDAISGRAAPARPMRRSPRS